MNAPNRRAAPAGTIAGAHAQPLSGRRILVVDDSETACVILRLMLERQGAQVETVTSGAAALAAIRRAGDAFDIVLMDLVMEGLDGFGTIEQIRELRPGTRPAIIAMSATVTPAIAARCVALGTHPRLLRKPYRAPEVLESIRELLGAAEQPAAAPSVDGAAPTARPAPGAAVGFDHAAALARCDGDTALLRSLLRAMRDGLQRAAREVADAVAGNDRALAAGRLHRIRGEALNLGLDGIAREFEALEADLHAGMQREAATTALSGLVRRTAERLDEILGRLAPGQAPSDGLDHPAFVRLVQAMARADPTAVSLAPPNGRVLPMPYDNDTDAAFRERLEALDFGGARALLAPEDDQPEDPGTGNEPSVLLVDDHPGTVRLIARVLAPVGRLRFALSGERALAMARDAPPDLVVADINMGDMSGIALCKALKAELVTAEIPVILISASGDVTTEARALTAGAVDFIEKPLNPARALSRVGAQLELRRRAAELRSLLSGGPISASLGFLMCDAEGRLTDIGPGVAATLDIDRDDAIGTDIASILAADRQPALAAELRRGISAGSVGPLEIALRTRAGTEIPVRLYGRTVSGAEGRRFWIKLDDMRDRVRLERERLDREKAAAILSITAGVAHEFNNILGIVLGNIDSAIDEIDQPDQVRRRLHAAQAAAERGADISRAMLASAQHEANPAGEALVIDDLIAALWPVLANALPKRMVLRREPSGRPLRAIVDPDGMRAALIALLANAADAHPGRGVVTIRSFEEPARPGQGAGMVAIEVVDDGPGMAAEVRERAFDPFFTTRSPYRVGLGLTSVHSFAVRHSGSADIRSAPGQGTCVTIRLPLAHARQTQSVAPRD